MKATFTAEELRVLKAAFRWLGALTIFALGRRVPEENAVAAMDRLIASLESEV